MSVRSWWIGFNSQEACIKIAYCVDLDEVERVCPNTGHRCSGGSGRHTERAGVEMKVLNNKTKAFIFVGICQAKSIFLRKKSVVHVSAVSGILI